MRVDLNGSAGPRIQCWAIPDYMTALTALAEAQGLSPLDCAKRFGKVSVPDSERGWYFHPTLGYAKRR